MGVLSSKKCSIHQDHFRKYLFFLSHAFYLDFILSFILDNWSTKNSCELKKIYRTLCKVKCNVWLDLKCYSFFYHFCLLWWIDLDLSGITSTIIVDYFLFSWFQKLIYQLSIVQLMNRDLIIQNIKLYLNEQYMD